MKNKVLIGLAVIVVAGVALITTTAVSAQEEDLNIFQRVAQTLGVSEDNLTDAFKSAQKAEIDERVEADLMDAERAEEIKTRIDESEYPFPGMQRKEEMRNRRMKGGEAIAEFLGISVEELRESHQDGGTIEEIVEANGKTMEELHEFMSEKFGEDHFGPGRPKILNEE